MNTAVVPDLSSIPSMVSSLVGSEVSALAMVCTVGEGELAAVTAFVTPGTSCSTKFRHAVEMEGDYNDHLLSFEETPPPFYGISAVDVDLEEAAQVIGVDRVLCLITQVGSDQISVFRNYEDVEVTVLEAAKVQFDGLTDMLVNVAPGRRTLQ